jgi:Xaa-Pro aminopeptidase
MILLGSEYFSTGPLVATGARTSVPNVMFRRAKIEEGDPVTIELAASYHRYSVPLVRTRVAGVASDEVRTLSNLAQRVLDKLIASVEVGRAIGDVVRIAQRELSDGPTEIWPIRSMGHEIGVDLPPSWKEPSLDLTPGNSAAFAEGMAFHSPVAIRIPGRVGVAYSESWIVEARGARVLSAVPRELEQ